MISSKVGTQTFSKAEQRTDFKDDKVNYTPATKTAGDGKEESQNVGDILNAVANPGKKNPNKVQRQVGKNELGKDDFLKLMLTQMKHQDPMNPMQSHEMAAQLAQFTSLEQLFNVNKNLEAIGKGQEPTQKYEALNLLGKSIKADARQIFHQGGESNSELRFGLYGDTVKGKVTISDETGKTIKSWDLGPLKKGQNRIVWNGTDKDEREVKAGRYFFSIEAENTSGKKVGVQTETSGLITGINYTAEGPILMVGDQAVRLSDIQKIEDDSLRQAQAKRDEGLSSDAAKEALVKKVTQQYNQAQSTGDKNQTSQTQKPKVIPESKPKAELQGAVLPLEVASANAGAADKLGGSSISTGGAFGRK
ncbi:MAG: hypothetical protein IT289_08845 [Oligoflexia bacterium]|nr:hypothetical protein [Oligoflexia bacterium]